MINSHCYQLFIYAIFALPASLSCTSLMMSEYLLPFLPKEYLLRSICSSKGSAPWERNLVSTKEVEDSRIQTASVVDLQVKPTSAPAGTVVTWVRRPGYQAGFRVLFYWTPNMLQTIPYHFSKKRKVMKKWRWKEMKEVKKKKKEERRKKVRMNEKTWNCCARGFVIVEAENFPPFFSSARRTIWNFQSTLVKSPHTMGWNCMKSRRSFRREKSFSQSSVVSEWASE